MNARYWVTKALKEAAKDKANAGQIILKVFTQAIDHTENECADTFRKLTKDCTKCSTLLDEENEECQSMSFSATPTTAEKSLKA